MPIYEYACRQCGHTEEVFQKVSDAALTECPSCGGAFAKLISAPAFQFKGSGFYETDYKRTAHSGGIADESKVAETKTAAVESTDKKGQPTTGTPKKEILVS